MRPYTLALLAPLLGCTADSFTGSDADPPDSGQRDGFQEIRPDGGDAGTDADPPDGSPSDASADQDSAATTDASDGATPSAKRIFRTSSYYYPQFSGGLTGADSTCASVALGASLSGTWRAWLSDVSTSAASRLTHNAGAYELVTGTKVASDWAGLTSGSLFHAIDHDESGTLVTPTTSVWTGTAGDGTSMTTCQDWTSQSSSDHGELGTVNGTGAGWTASSNFNCAFQAALYCVEQ